VPVPVIKSPQPELYQKLDNWDADIRSLEYKDQTPQIVWENKEIEKGAGLIQSTSALSITWQGVLFLGWAVVFLVLLLLLLQRAMFVKGLVRQSELITGGLNDLMQSCCRQLGIKSKISLKASPNATSPAVCGLFRPAILLPQNLLSKLSKEQVKAVLFHELVHIKRGDLWVNLVQTLLQIVYFYNPFVWLANAMIRRIREQAVDEAVQVALGSEAQSYPKILVDVAKMTFKRPALSLRLIGVVENKGALKGRISRMLSRPIPKRAKLSLVGLLAIIIIGIIILPMAAAKVGEPTLVIKGTVTYSVTGKPIVGAKVFDDGYGPGPDWQNTKAGEQSKWGAITDANGQYSFLTWPEHHSIKVEADNCESQTKTLYSGHFTLNKKPEEIFDFTLKKSNKTDVQIETSLWQDEGEGVVGESDLVWGDDVNGLRAAIEIVPKKESYSLDEVIKVRFHLQNISKDRIQFQTYPWTIDFARIHVEGKKEDKIISGPYVSQWRDVTTMMIQAGQTVYFDGRINLGGSRPNDDFMCYVLYCRPGRYLLSGLLRFPQHESSVPQQQDKGETELQRLYNELELSGLWKVSWKQAKSKLTLSNQPPGRVRDEKMKSIK